MNSIYYIIFFLFLSPSLFGQDTLIQTNSHEYGFSQTYVMHTNGQFTYESVCICTSSKNCGSGYYIKDKHYISFHFDSTLSLNQSPDCHFTITQATHTLKQKKKELIRFNYVSIEVENPDKPWRSKRKKVKKRYTYARKN